MKQSPNFLLDVLNQSTDMIFVLRLCDDRLEYMNETAQKELGYSFEALRTLGVMSIRQPMNPNKESFLRHLDELKREGALIDYAVLRRKDGSSFAVEARVKHVVSEGEDYNIAIVHDISVRLEQEHKLFEVNQQLESLVVERTAELEAQMRLLENYKEALDESNIVSKSDLSGRIIEVNEKFVQVSGYSREELLYRPHNVVRHPDTPREVFEELWRTILDKKVWKGIVKNRSKSGGSYWVDMIIKPLLDKSGEIEAFIAVRHDITETIEQREAIQRSAYVDALTGLPTRTRLQLDLRALQAPSVALLNVDGFSKLNDFYGHLFGDRIIMALAQRMREQLSGALTLYHLHADEFLVLNRYLHKERFVEMIQQLITMLNATLLPVETTLLRIEVSGSLSFEPVNELLSSVDIALKQVKKRQDRLLVYTPELSISSDFERNMLWSEKLKRAIDEGRIVAYYQPIVDNATMQISKYEALVRLIDEEGAVFTPYHFLSVAKRSKQYRSITKAMIRSAFATVALMQESISINLSIDDVLDPVLQNYLEEMLGSYGVGPKVILELLESEGIENFEAVAVFIAKMKGYGCCVAIDDFGTGYSNFGYLMRLQADFIKIDGSMIRRLEHDANARIIVETIVGFAKRMGIQTVAEFVENEAIFQTVQEIGIDFSQGYYFAPPAAIPLRQTAT